MSTSIQPIQSSELAIIEPGRLDENPAAVYLASLGSEHSRRNMARYLNEIAVMLGYQPVIVEIEGKRKKESEFTYLYCDWGKVRYQHTAAIRSRLADEYAPATVNVMIAALRGVLKEAWRLGVMSADEYMRAVDVKPVRGSTLPAGRSIAMGEMLALVNACTADETPAGIRDAAIIGILYTGGLRRAELAALELADFDRTSNRLTIRSGKGRKARTVFIENGALAALLDWLTIRGDEPGALFYPVNKAGTMQPKTITAQAIYNMLKKRAHEAGVSEFSCHDFRRTMIGDLLDRGVDTITVKNIAGHASADTTGRYDRRPEETKRQAVAKLHFPYKRQRLALEK